MSNEHLIGQRGFSSNENMTGIHETANGGDRFAVDKDGVEAGRREKDYFYENYAQAVASLAKRQKPEEEAHLPADEHPIEFRPDRLMGDAVREVISFGEAPKDALGQALELMRSLVQKGEVSETAALSAFPELFGQPIVRQETPATNIPNSHSLRCDPNPFAAIWSGHKKSEIRKNDRDYKEGDTLALYEQTQSRNHLTGRSVLVRVTHIQSAYGLPESLIAMSFTILAREVDGVNIGAYHRADPT